MKLKVCGMKFPDNIEAIAKLQPDYLGFIFYKKSTRFFDAIIPSLPDAIKKVGVFVDASAEDIITLANNYNLDVIQLHGNQTKEFVLALNKLVSLYANKEIEIWKVFSVDKHFNFKDLHPFENEVHKYLFDTKGQLKGGNGYTFNWEILKEYPSKKPFILSGGIGLDEVENIKNFFKLDVSKNCFALDVNSQFEIKSGLKNIEALEKFKNKLHHFK
ncbi:phosphoribosylanthranilate isomerase [Bizionia echini]|uniref:N-(5'-phosphoribosyl)anthranilate isomerase n=1 Tax=Bizionia echini TaxID=649333 RepID=A0A1I5DMI3_9FLAO|nr:phosphoribosylanthranilate isomerase [Bizionia echini]SFO00454.1 phosphoribosylanthranilate isomerase [Bizionia echini]